MFISCKATLHGTHRELAVVLVQAKMQAMAQRIEARYIDGEDIGW
jgi:hypothetical protein